MTEGEEISAAPMGRLTSMKALYQKYQRWTPIAFFIAGFIFDAYMLRRVDELLTIVQQAVYILISAVFIRIEITETQREIIPHRWFSKAWHYREDALHFLMGTLLNAYTIFYFKSSSTFTSLAFIVILVGILILNEFGRFGKSQTQVHVGILSLCLISYLVTLLPIILGHIGLLPFLIANAIAALVFWFYVYTIRPVVALQPRVLRTHLQVPFASVLGVFAVLYFSGMIPPVPLSVRYIGVFHEVKKLPGGDYELSYSRPDTYFWQHGDETFLARPGDTIICFARVFSPSRFKDDLRVRWLRQDVNGHWQSMDVIPFPIVGGRDEGFRGITRKTNYQAGDWRVQIETHDGREVGRIGFTIETDTSVEPREMKTIIE